jgi:glycogen(starch) synthase
MADENGSEPIKRDVRNHMLFEVATEVANRVGGIYSVLKSKAPVTTAEYGERYTMIGPLNRASAAVEVEELTPASPAMRDTIASMKERGIEIVYGRWLIEGAPRVLLINTGTGYRWLDEWKGDLWNTSGIPAPAADHETNEAIVFGYLVAWFLGEVSRIETHSKDFNLYCAGTDSIACSTLPTNAVGPWSLISMNG